MIINNIECRVISVRCDDGKIVTFYAPNDWAINDITGIIVMPRGDFPHSQTTSFTGFVVYQNIKYAVTGTKDRGGMISFYLMPDTAENHYGWKRI